MRRILALALIFLLLFTLAACGKGKVEDNTSTVVSSEGAFVSIFINGTEYHIHGSGTASLADWYEEYGKANGWILKNGEIYTADEKQKIDTAGLPIDQETLWSGQSFGLIEADSQTNQDAQSKKEEQQSSGNTYIIPELNSVEGVPSFAKKGIGKESYCYKIDDPNYLYLFNIEFHEVSNDLLETYTAYLRSNNPASVEDFDNGEYHFIWAWGQIDIYYQSSKEIMAVNICAKRS